MRHLLVPTILVLFSTVVTAGDQPARPDGAHRHQQLRDYLRDHPEAREKAKAWLQNHPEAREKLKERLRAHLEQHPESRERLRERRRSE